MLATTAGYQQMLAGHTVTGGIARISLTLPSGVTDVSATVTKLSVNASTVTDMPDGTRLAAGYPSMQLTFTLADKARLFAPYNTGSAMFRQTALKCAVTQDTGWNVPGSLGVVEWLRGFTGTVDSYQCNQDGSVDFTCIDNRNLLRSVPDLAAVVTIPPFNAGLTSEFAVDALLQATGAYSRPLPRPQCVLSVGMRSSVWPDVGTLDTSVTSARVSFGPGMFGSALTSTQDLANPSQTIVPYILAAPISNVFTTEGWFKDTTATGDQGATFYVGYVNSLSSTEYVAVSIQSTQVRIGFTTGGFKTVTVPAGDKYVGITVNLPSAGGNTWSATVRAAGTTTTIGPFTGGAVRAQSTWQKAFVDFGPDGAQEAWQITTESSPTWNDTFVPRAILDPSLNVLQVVPALSGDPWQIIQQIADAERAVAGFDTSGIFRFTNRNTLRSSAVTRSIQSNTSLTALAIAVSGASYADQVTVPYTSWNFAAPGLVFTGTGLLKAPKRSTKSWTVTVSDLVAQVDGTASKLANGHTTTDGNSYYRASQDSAGLNEHPGVTVTVFQPNSGQITITVVNSTSVDAYLVSPANYTDIAVGTPALWVGGIAVTAASEITVSAGTGDTVVPIGSNPWIQDDDTASLFASDLLADLSVARPDLTGVAIVPDPSIQLMDRVRFIDPDVSGVDEYAVIWGWDLDLEDGQWGMTIDARTVAPPGGWIGGVAGRSEGGVTTYGY